MLNFLLHGMLYKENAYPVVYKINLCTEMSIHFEKSTSILSGTYLTSTFGLSIFIIIMNKNINKVEINASVAILKDIELY
jgi:hypothetical protein